MNILFLSIFFTSFVFADYWVIDSDVHSQIIESKRDLLFVSLGSTCFPAGLLRSSELREVAFPFDWCFSLDNESLSFAIEEGLIHFLDTEYLIPDCLLLTGATGASLIHFLYHLDFVHEGNFREVESIVNMDSFQKRYERRIERFRNLSKYSGTVVFIRCCYKHGLVDPHRYFKSEHIVDISDDDAVRLYQALRFYFPDLKMKLLILNEGNFSAEGIVFEKMIHDDIWKIRHTFFNEQNMYSEYKKFLHSIK
ncbi:MAG TPA: DUF1796 family putative cysteine peptidase [Chlamydiales bacterium]|nr:DUF1796 family putative cysteine peptidase [Chlamydiales bacterium]